MPEQEASTSSIVIVVLLGYRTHSIVILRDGIDTWTAQRFCTQYRERPWELVDRDRVAEALDLIGTAFDGYLCQVPDMRRFIEARRLRRAIRMEPFQDVLERFERLLGHFPFPLPCDPIRARRDPIDLHVDPDMMRERWRIVAQAPAWAYPKSETMLDFWIPPDADEDPEGYQLEIEGLQTALRRSVGGFSSIYRDAAFRLCAPVAMLCRGPDQIHDLVDAAETAVRRFWSDRTRHELAARKRSLLKVLKDAGDYVPRESMWENMCPNALAFVEAREECRVRFDGALVPIVFEIDSHLIWSGAMTNGPHVGIQWMTAAWIGDDDELL